MKKKVFLKGSFLEVSYTIKILSNILLPPQPIISFVRIPYWLESVFFYGDNFEEFKVLKYIPNSELER